MKRANDNPRAILQDDLLKMFELRQEGRSLTEISKETGVSLGAVGKYLKGVPVGTPIAHPPIDLRSPYEVNPADPEVDNDPFAIVRSHSDLLSDHAKIGTLNRQYLANMSEGLLRTWKEIEGAAWVSEDMIEKAVRAAIRSIDSEGEVIYEAPTDDEMLRRRLAYINQINQIERNRIGTINDLLKASQLAIKIERQAAGLDYVQELAVSLARVMSAGYTVEG